jgi:hypothetical protein
MIDQGKQHTSSDSMVLQPPASAIFTVRTEKFLSQTQATSFSKHEASTDDGVGASSRLLCLPNQQTDQNSHTVTLA